MSDESLPVTPKPSATVVVVRAGPTGPEVLLVRRRSGDAFGNSYAFPGGVVDHDESAARAVCSGIGKEEATRILGVPDALDYYSAAVRELFEETGILLARDDDGRWATSRPPDDEERIAVDKSLLPWTEFLARHGLCIAADALHYFAFWETPLVRPKRWQTRFFAAPLPPGQSATHDGSEVTDSRWLTPADALALGRQKALPMPFPTVRIMTDLARFDDAAGLLGWAGSRAGETVDKIRPAEKRIDGKPVILVPGDAGYEEADREWQKHLHRVLR